MEDTQIQELRKNRFEEGEDDQDADSSRDANSSIEKELFLSRHEIEGLKTLGLHGFELAQGHYCLTW